VSTAALPTQPLVTVAMPVYNAGKYLRLAVLSIVKQTFAEWEMLIIDDGSTDNALQDIADIEDARIRISRDGQNKGLAVRLNECIDMARGQYFARMDQDDVSYPERLARQLAILQSDPELDLVATRAIIIDENESVTGLFPSAISHREICAQPWRGFYFPHPTWMGRTEWFYKYRYTVPGPYFCEDQDMLLRSYRDSRFITQDEVLFAYRIRSNINWKKQIRTHLAVLVSQLRQFLWSGTWHFFFLALAVFLARLCSVSLRKLSVYDSRRSHDKLIEAERIRWSKVLEGLSMGKNVL